MIFGPSMPPHFWHIDSAMQPTLTTGAPPATAAAGAAALPAPTALMEEGEATKARADEYDRALTLSRMFCCGGRDACDWSKSDLRLINSCVVPEPFGSQARIDQARQHRVGRA